MPDKLRRKDQTATRITLKRGRSRRSFVLTEGPRPDVGDACTLNGEDWAVVKVEQTPIVASFSTQGGKLRQVFP